MEEELSFYPHELKQQHQKTTEETSSNTKTGEIRDKTRL